MICCYPNTIFKIYSNLKNFDFANEYLGAIFMLADFSENFHHQSQDSAQQDYFCQLSTTLFIVQVCIYPIYQMIFLVFNTSSIL